jgi:hypothetical protein
MVRECEEETIEESIKSVKERVAAAKERYYQRQEKKETSNETC